MTNESTNWMVLARELTGWQLMERIKAGHDIALVPVGSVELHGPQLPLGTDTYVAEAVCQLAAATMKGTVLDTVSYTWPGMTKYSVPTVSMTMNMETDYVRMVCDQLLRIGLRRIYVVQFHGPGIALQRLAREFFEETGVPLVFYGLMRMRDDSQEDCRKRGIAWEGSLCAAAAKVLGVTPSIAPDALRSTEAVAPPPGSKASRAIAETGGFLGRLGSNDLHHGVLDGRIDVGMGMKILKTWAEAIASSAPHFAKLRDAWKDVDLPGSWPSTVLNAGRRRKARRTDAGDSR